MLDVTILFRFWNCFEDVIFTKLFCDAVINDMSVEAIDNKITRVFFTLGVHAKVMVLSKAEDGVVYTMNDK